MSPIYPRITQKKYNWGARPEGTLLQSEATKRLSPIVSFCQGKDLAVQLKELIGKLGVGAAVIHLAEQGGMGAAKTLEHGDALAAHTSLWASPM